MHALDVLGDPVRRRILELLSDGEASAGAIATVIGEEFGISQPAVSQHLRILREQGFATVRPEGQRRLYAVDASGPSEAREWLSAFDGFWMPKLAALDTELARGRRLRRRQADGSAAIEAARRRQTAARGARVDDETAGDAPADTTAEQE
ncbi:metalloregulator ArsR/SmtB family transcription factor [Agrococcus sp. ProA11]|uniref:ArsR/SmtB family transcription factor n=1 Tax=Agrococcus chionoecetis TaxID=3153752 RepID=UPI003260B39A